MGIKTIVVLLVGLALASLAEAQQAKKVYRIGFLSAGSPSSGLTGPGSLLQGLRELGYVEGQNIVIEYRYSQGKEDRLPDLATELVRKRVDVIIATSTPAAQAAKKSTVTIPIVMTFVGDPVASGLVASLV